MPWKDAQGLPKHMPAPEPLQKDWSQELKAAELPEQQPQTQGACALSPWNVHEGAAAHVAASNPPWVMCREKETATAREPAAVETTEDPRVVEEAKAASVATPIYISRGIALLAHRVRPPSGIIAMPSWWSKLASR